MGPQQALETALVNAILADSTLMTTLGAVPKDVRRMFDGHPEPRCGNVFVAVWSGGGRRGGERTSLDETFALNVTVTVRATQPFDRLVQHRDAVTEKLDAVIAFVHKDQYNFAISNAAGVLAGFDGAGQPVGFREALAFAGLDDCEAVGGEWFQAAPDSRQVGVAQTARFGKSRRVRALVTVW